MPRLSRYFIRIGLIYFVLSLAMGTLVLAQPVFDLPGWVAAMRPVYLHWLMVGWITHLIIGVSIWMFPKETKERPRGSIPLGWAILILLNSGLLLRAIGEIGLGAYPGSAIGWTLVISAILQWLASLAYIVHIWRRVKER